jgi:hypothetical protein
VLYRADHLSLSCAGNLEQSMGARNPVGKGLSYWPARDGIFKHLGSPGIDSKEKYDYGADSPYNTRLHSTPDYHCEF